MSNYPPIANPETDGLGGYTLEWPLGEYDETERTIPVQITVTVMDELGLSASETVNGTVTVGALPPLPTAIPTLVPTPIPTLVPTPVPTPTNAGVFSASGATSPLFIALIALSWLAAVYFYLKLRRTRREAAEERKELEILHDAEEMEMSPQAPVAVTPAPTNGNQPEPEKPLYARLVVINGLDDLEILIDSERFIIGRSEKGTDYRIDAPFISPRHCEFTFRNGNFRLRDMGTKNGTYVNGDRVPLERDVAVPIGSEIGITKNITVELWDPRKIIDYDQKRLDRKQNAQLATKTRTHHGELEFPGWPGIQYLDDDQSEIDDEYSPS
jgi:hypothetical protein